MSVYKEGYMIVQDIQSKSKQIWDDACDYGVLVKKDDQTFNAVKQLTEWYGVKGTRVEQGDTGYKSVNQTIFLMDEWAVSDKRKTEEEAKDLFNLSFVQLTDRKLNRQGYIGIVSLDKLNTKNCNHTPKVVYSGGNAEDGPRTVTRCTKCGDIQEVFGM